MTDLSALLTPTTASGVLRGPEEFDTWREAVCNAFVPLDALSRSDGDFGGDLANMSIGAVQISDVSGGPVDIARTSSAIRRSDPGYLKLGMQLAGRCLVTQDGHEAHLAPGDLAMYDTSRPYELCFDRRFRMMVVMFPRELFSVAPRQLAVVTARRVPGRTGVGALVAPFLTNLAAALRSSDVTLSFELSNAVIDLLAVALSDQYADGTSATEESRGRALMLRVKAFVDARLGDLQLNTVTLAEAHHISPRYLQKLFESEGTTPTEWIRHRRLESCKRELMDPRRSDAPIGLIAARWGLLDSAHFSRLFRSTYGVSPREFRAASDRPVSRVG